MHQNKNTQKPQAPSTAPQPIYSVSYTYMAGEKIMKAIHVSGWKIVGNNLHMATVDGTRVFVANVVTAVAEIEKEA